MEYREGRDGIETAKGMDEREKGGRGTEKWEEGCYYMWEFGDKKEGRNNLDERKRQVRKC